MRVLRARPVVCVAAVCTSLLGAAQGRASQANLLRVTLEYAAGPGCPTAAEFKAVVAGRLGYDPFLEDMPDRVLVRLTPRRGAIDGRLEWRDSAGGLAGDQSFPSVSTDCARFVRVVGFALAVQIQLLANVRAASPPADPAPNAAPKDAPNAAPKDAPLSPSPSLGTDRPLPTPVLREKPPEPPAASVVAPAPSPPPPAPRPVLAVGVGPSVGLGMSSSPILIGRILGVLAWTHVSLELAAEVSVPTITRRMDGAGFSQRHLLLGLAGCAVLAPWNACVVAKGGEVLMAGIDIERRSSAVAPVIEAGLRVGAVKGLGRRAALNAHVDGLSALSRWTATLDKVPVWSAPRFAAVVGIDAVVRFP